MLSKKEKKKILSELRAVEKRNFYEKLLISKEMFEALFYYLDEKLQEHGCQDTREFTLQFLTDHAIDPVALIAWLEDESVSAEAQGASCDCDILWILSYSDKIDAQAQYYT
jgi:hypothetical protein